VNVQPQESVA